MLPRNRPLTIVVWTVAGLVLIAADARQLPVRRDHQPGQCARSPSRWWCSPAWSGRSRWRRRRSPGWPAWCWPRSATDVPFPFSLVIAVAVATIVGTLVGLPALRIRGAQLAVVTLAAAVAVEELVFDGPGLLANSGSIPSWRLFGIDLSVHAGRDLARWPYAVFVLAGGGRGVRRRRQRAARHHRSAAAGRALQRARCGRRRGRRAQRQARRVRLVLWSRWSRRRAHRHQPGTAVVGLVRGVRRPRLPRRHLPQRDRQHVGCGRRRRAGGARRRVRRARPLARRCRVLRADRRAVADHHGDPQPLGYRRAHAVARPPAAQSARGEGPPDVVEDGAEATVRPRDRGRGMPHPACPDASGRSAPSCCAWTRSA